MDFERQKKTELSRTEAKLRGRVDVERRLFEDGTEQLLLTTPDGATCDVGELMQPGWRFAGNTYRERLIENGETEVPPPGFTCDYQRRIVFVGDIASERDVLGLFHEIGHAEHSGAEPELFERMGEITAARRMSPGQKVVVFSPAEQVVGRRLEAEEFGIRRVAETEAWRRGIERLAAVSALPELFPSPEELRTFILKNIGTYRERFLTTLEGDAGVADQLARSFDADPDFLRWLNDFLGRQFTVDAERP